MKKAHLLIPLLLVLNVNLLCQDKSPVKNQELYLTCSSLNTFKYGLQHKIGFNELVYFRYGISDIVLQYDSFLPGQSNTYPNQAFVANIKMNIGIEKRKVISETISWFFGLDIIDQIMYRRINIDNPNLTLEDRKTDNYSYSIGFGVPFGIVFRLNKNILFATEFEPELSYRSVITGIPQSDYTYNSRRIELSKETLKFSIIYKIR